MKPAAAFEVVTSTRDRAQWLEARRQGIGSSDAPVALGCYPWKTRLALYAEKLGIDPVDEVEPGEPAYWGTVLEPLVLDRFRRETGRRVRARRQLLRSKARPWQLCTLDGEQVDPVRGRGIVEVKCTALEHRWRDGPPSYVQVQIQHQLAVTGYAWGSVAVLFHGNEFFWLDVDRDEAMIADLVQQEQAFWTAVEIRVAPEPTGSEADTRTIGRLFPRDDPGTEPLSLDGEWLALDERRDEILTTVEGLNTERTEIENRLRLVMGERTAALLPNGVVYTLKQQTRKEYTVAERTFRVLRRHGPREG